MLKERNMEETPNNYATVEDLSLYWRTILSSETNRANDLLTLASSRLRVIAAEAGVDIDQKVEDDQDYANVAKWVTMEAVKRALATPTDVPPVDNYSLAAGPYSENYRFTNPSGDLWFKKSELKDLGLAGRQMAKSITPNTRRNIYGE